MQQTCRPGQWPLVLTDGSGGSYENRSAWTPTVRRRPDEYHWGNRFSARRGPLGFSLSARRP